MIKISAFLSLITLALVPVAMAQSLTMDFDTDRVGYGISETSGTAVRLALSINGSPTAADNFNELAGLSNATVAASGSELGVFSPFSFTMESSVGGVFAVQADGIDISGGDFDPGESLTFIFGVDVLLTGFDFASIGAGEFAQVSIGGTVFTYGDSTGDNHSLSQSLSAGAPLIFQYADSAPAAYNLQGVNLSIVPEPATYALFAGSFALCLIVWRSRRMR